MVSCKSAVASKATLFFAGYACSIHFRTTSVRRRSLNLCIRNLPLGLSERPRPSITTHVSRCQSSLLVPMSPTERAMGLSSEHSVISELLRSCQHLSKALTTGGTMAAIMHPRLRPVSKGLGLVVGQPPHLEQPLLQPARVLVQLPEVPPRRSKTSWERAESDSAMVNLRQGPTRPTSGEESTRAKDPPRDGAPTIATMLWTRNLLHYRARLRSLITRHPALLQTPPAWRHTPPLPRIRPLLPPTPLMLPDQVLLQDNRDPQPKYVLSLAPKSTITAVAATPTHRWRRRGGMAPPPRMT